MCSLLDTSSRGSSLSGCDSQRREGQLGRKEAKGLSTTKVGREEREKLTLLLSSLHLESISLTSLESGFVVLVVGARRGGRRGRKEGRARSTG